MNDIVPSEGSLEPRPNDQNALLTREDFRRLADVPPEAEWFGNIRNPNTKRAYENDVREFARFVGISRPEDFRMVTRAHVITWRDQLEKRLVSSDWKHQPRDDQKLSESTIRRKLSALASLFNYLCDQNAVADNPVHGVKRPGGHANEGKTDALSKRQACRLLAAPDTDTIKGLRDRAILADLLYHALRCDELCKLRAQDRRMRSGIPHLKLHRKGDKEQFIPENPHAIRLRDEYLVAAGRDQDRHGPIYRPITNNRTKTLDQAMTPSGVYKIVKHYGRVSGLADEFGCDLYTHMTRATAITEALNAGADLKKVQPWVGHANISTTRLYDKTENPPEESPTYVLNFGQVR